jgi:nicotinate phosphoribosyltransferase
LDSQKKALEVWMNTYPNGELASALTDTLGLDCFLKTFDYRLASWYKSLRQDSGHPMMVCDMIIDHYKKLGIDPLQKTIMFSDNLTIDKAFELQSYCYGKINCSFGIGTGLVSDLGAESLQCVIKIVEANGRPVAKISDSEGKSMCENSGYMNYLREIIK